MSDHEIIASPSVKTNYCASILYIKYHIGLNVT